VSLADVSVQVSQLVPIGDGRLVLVGAVLENADTQGTWRPVAWESANLTDWEMTDLGIPEESAISDLARGPKGHVAAAGERLWFAPDGVTWQLAYEPPPGDMNVRAGEEGFVATGSAADGAYTAASGDGLTWFEGQTLAAPGLSITAVGGGDWLAVGGENELQVWASDDGLCWEPTVTIGELTGLTSGVGLTTEVTHTYLVTMGDEAYMTLAWNHCCAQLSGSRGVWSSPNGTDWSQREFDLDEVVQAGATDGDTIVLAGFRGRGAEGVIWVSE